MTPCSTALVDIVINVRAVPQHSGKHSLFTCVCACVAVADAVVPVRSATLTDGHVSVRARYIACGVDSGYAGRREYMYYTEIQSPT
jgi:hypothetical protein